MARGGPRAGSGRKPRHHDGVVLVMPARPGRVVPATPMLEPEEVAGLLTAPAELQDSAKAIWGQWANHAIAERTLTPATAAGFGQLCQQWVYLSMLVGKIDHLGVDTKEAAPYLLSYLKLAQRLDNSLARFKLTAFGKPAISEKPKTAANPWAQVAAK